MNDANLAKLFGEASRIFGEISKAYGGSSKASTPNVDIDGRYGDPVIKFDPKRWNGDSFVGKKLSQCSIEYLEVFAEFKEWAAANPLEGKEPKYVEYDRKDGLLARAWIERKRSGGKKTKQPDPQDEDLGGEMSDDIPFAPNLFESR